VEGYPKGRWIYVGRVTTSSEARFLDNPLLSGYINQQTTRRATFLTDRPPQLSNAVPPANAYLDFSEDVAPNSNLSYESSDPATGYKAHFDGQVNATGCVIKGNFSDNKGHSGDLQYFWIAPFE